MAVHEKTSGGPAPDERTGPATNRDDPPVLRWEPVGEGRIRLWRSGLLALSGVLLAWLPLLGRSATPALPALVAHRPLAAGHRLETSDLVVRPLPIRHPRQVLPTHRPLVLGRTLALPLAPDQPLLWSDLRPVSDTTHPLASRLPGGHRAITIELDAAGRFGGALAVGDRIDLWWQGGRLEKLAERIRVLALDGRTSGTAGHAGLATFAVPVSRVAELLTRRRAGRFLFSLVPWNSPGPARWLATASRHRPPPRRPKESRLLLGR